jgi:hypothetical protein
MRSRAKLKKHYIGKYTQIFNRKNSILTIRTTSVRWYAGTTKCLFGEVIVQHGWNRYFTTVLLES